MESSVSHSQASGRLCFPVLYKHHVPQQMATKPKPNGLWQKRKRVDEEPLETDDDVQVVHDIPDDGHDTGDGGAESGEEDGAASYWYKISSS
jgi:hypothetical protein